MKHHSGFSPTLVCVCVCVCVFPCVSPDYPLCFNQAHQTLKEISSHPLPDCVAPDCGNKSCRSVFSLNFLVFCFSFQWLLFLLCPKSPVPHASQYFTRPSALSPLSPSNFLPVPSHPPQLSCSTTSIKSLLNSQAGYLIQNIYKILLEDYGLTPKTKCNKQTKFKTTNIYWCSCSSFGV